MVNLFGSGVKCLVTFQRGDLCQGLNFSAMPIKIDVNQDHARKVLASHVGFSNQLMLEHLKVMMQEKMLSENKHFQGPLVNTDKYIQQGNADHMACRKRVY